MFHWVEVSGDNETANDEENAASEEQNHSIDDRSPRNLVNKKHNISSVKLLMFLVYM